VNTEMLAPAQTEFRLHYEVPDAELSTATLIETLLGIQSIIKEASRQLDPARRLELRVRAIGRGSFEVFLQLDSTGFIGGLISLFSTGSLTYLQLMLDVVSRVLTLSKWRAENKQIETQQAPDGIIVKCEDGNVLFVKDSLVNIVLNGLPAGQAADRTLNALASDVDVSAFKILDKDEAPLFEVGERELRMIAAKQAQAAAETSEPNTRIVTRRATLGILKPSLDRKYKWDFAYAGSRIQASITDQVFLERVELGLETFRAGDELVCEIVVTEERASDGSYHQRGHEVVHIIDHAHRAEQLSLEGGEQE
jgi:hypothetical protein